MNQQDDFIADFQKDAQKLSLTPEEKESSRAVLQFMQSATSLKLDPADKAAFRVQLVERMHAASSKMSISFVLHSFLFRGPVFAALALLLLGASSVGLAYAAEQSHPGDFLYSVKINVTEPIIGTFKRTPKQKAEWAVEQMQRRVSEVLDMVERPLTDTEDAELSRLLERYASDADSKVAQVETQEEKAVLREQLDRAFKVEERRLEREMENKPSRRTLQTLWEIRKRSEVLDESEPSRATKEKYPVPSRRAPVRLVPEDLGTRVQESSSTSSLPASNPEASAAASRAAARAASRSSIAMATSSSSFATATSSSEEMEDDDETSSSPMGNPASFLPQQPTLPSTPVSTPSVPSVLP